MWKYRNAIVFCSAMAFAARAAILGDWVSICGVVLFLGAHYVDRFFGSERFESKAIARVAALEEDLKSIRTDLGRLNLTAGIRGNLNGR